MKELFLLAVPTLAMTGVLVVILSDVAKVAASGWRTTAAVLVLVVYAVTLVSMGWVAGAMHCAKTVAEHTTKG
jgi:hypothetical protein